MDRQQIIAHRGAWKDFAFPQNSVAAFLKAQELKLGGTEFDLQFTKDEKVIIAHDDTFRGSYISQKRYIQLRGYQFFKHEKTLTFKRLLRFWGGETTLWIELKPSNLNGIQKKKFCKEVLHILADRKSNIHFISFDFSIVKELRKLSDLSCFYLDDDLSIEKLHKNEIYGIDADYCRYFNDETLLPTLKKWKMQSNAWTVNDKAIADKLIHLGVDTITTDEVLEMIA